MEKKNTTVRSNIIILTAKSCIFLYLSEPDASDGPEQLWHEHKDGD